MNERNISQMTNKGILRQQLELLAEHSKKCNDESIVPISNAMLDIANYLESSSFSKE